MTIVALTQKLATIPRADTAFVFGVSQSRYGFKPWRGKSSGIATDNEMYWQTVSIDLFSSHCGLLKDFQCQDNALDR